MPRLDHCHWLVATGEGTWKQIAVGAGCTSDDLLKANDISPGGGAASQTPRVGRLIHTPFVGS